MSAVTMKLNKAEKDGYWWRAGPPLWLDPDGVESFEQMQDRTPGGSTSNAYVLVVMKSGIQHKVYGDFSDFEAKYRDARELS